MHRILVIDDDESVADTLSEILRRQGYAVDTEYSHESGLKQIKTHHYAVVVTDLRLGDSSGNDIVCYLRENAPYTMGILFSAYPSRDAVQRARHCSALQFLVKPCDPDLFRLTIQRAVDLHESWVEVRDIS